VAGPDGIVAEAFVFIRARMAAIGLTMKYGPKKTCCWAPRFPTGDSEDEVADRAARATFLSTLPAEVVRLGGGMRVLGAYVGSDDFVRATALADVEAAGSRSIATACAEIEALARSEARNARDIAGQLLRCCVIPKVSYLCRTVRPDLLLPAARRVDDLVAHAFCAAFSINAAIFTAAATAEQRFAAARVRLPTSLNGCGLRSAVTTSSAAFLASLRAVAPAIAAASSPAAQKAVTDLCAQSAAPCLRALAAAAAAAAADLMSPEDKVQVALDGFSKPPSAGLQRKVTHARERALLVAATAAARPDAKMQAFLHSCCGRWVRAARLRFMQLSNEEAVVRMQRYLRLPLSALAGIVGTVAVDTARSVIDPFGDCFMSGYKAMYDGEWRHLHNALCRAISGFASQAHVSNQLEGGKIAGTKKRPGDVRFAGDSGAHGWAKAGAKELWIDATVDRSYAPCCQVRKNGVFTRETG
jgi:hypothetical protein